MHNTANNCTVLFNLQINFVKGTSCFLSLQQPWEIIITVLKIYQLKQAKGLVPEAEKSISRKFISLQKKPSTSLCSCCFLSLSPRWKIRRSQWFCSLHWCLAADSAWEKTSHVRQSWESLGQQALHTSGPLWLGGSWVPIGFDINCLPAFPFCPFTRNQCSPVNPSLGFLLLTGLH